MSIEDSHVLLSKNGEIERPLRYIYIQPSIVKNELTYELKLDCGIGDLLNAIFLLWESVKEEAQELSDQDIYELCGDFDLDYNLFRQHVRSDYNEEN